MVSKEEFINYLQKLISAEEREKIKIAEKNSKKTAPFMIIFIITSFVSAFLGVFLSSRVSGASSIFIVLFIIGFIGSFICCILLLKAKKILKQIEIKYKEQLIKFLLKDKKFEYDMKKYIDRKTFRRSGIYTGLVSYYKGEDYLSLNIPNDDGTDSAYNLILSDLIVQREYKNAEGKTHTQTIYNGLFGYIDFSFEFTHPFFINEKVYTSKSMERINLEDIKFNKNFKVYCDDQVEARYILTTSMMQKLMLLKAKVGNLFIIMKDKTMFLGFKWKELFNISSKKKVGDAFLSIYEDIEILLALVKEIQTNNKIFKI